MTRSASVGFVSLTGPPEGGDEQAYLRWHLLDHLPEQYGLPGLVHAQRWRADADCVAARVTGDDRLAPVRHALLYLMEDDAVLPAFVALGRRLWDAGRFPQRAPSPLTGPHRLVATAVARRVPVEPSVLPFRAHLGCLLVVEHGRPSDLDLDALVDVDGCAGAVVLEAGPDVAEVGRPLRWTPGPRAVTIAYCDADPVDVFADARPLLDRAPVAFATPLRTVTHLDAFER